MKEEKNNSILCRNTVVPLLCMLLFLLFATIGTAQEVQANQLKAVFIDNPFCVSEKSLLLSPTYDQTYNFDVALTNDGEGNNDLTVSISTSTGISNDTAIIYTEDTDQLLDASYDFSQYITVDSAEIAADQQLILAPNETKIVTFTLMIPSSSGFTGQLLGGLNFSQMLSSEKNVGINTLYEDVLTIEIDLQDSATIESLILSDFIFDYTNHCPMLSFNLNNPNPIIGNINCATLSVIDPNGQIVAEETLPENFLLTAKTTVPLSIQLEDTTEWTMGEYDIVLETVRSTVVTTFTCDQQVSETVITAQQSSDTTTSQSKNTYVVTALLIIVILLLLFHFIYFIKTRR